MRKIRLGELEKQLEKGGQPVLVFENHPYFFLIAKYHVAGRDFGFEGEGIGLNRQMLASFEHFRSAHFALPTNLVIESGEDRAYYMLSDVEKAQKRKGEWTDSDTGKPLVIFPHSAFEEVEIQDEWRIKKHRKRVFGLKT